MAAPSDLTLSQMRRLFESRTENYTLASDIATKFLDRGEPWGCARYLQCAIRHASGTSLASYVTQLADAIRQDEPAAAIHYYLKAIEADSTRSDAYVGVAGVYRDRFGCEELARSWLAKAIIRCRADLKTYVAFSTILLSDRSVAGVIAETKAVVPHNVDKRLLTVAIGNALMERGRYTEAVDVWQMFLPDSANLEADAVLGLALCYERLGDVDVAFRWYESGHSAFPNDPRLYRSYLMCLLRSGRTDEAHQMAIRRTLRVHPEGLTWWDGHKGRGRSFLIDTTPGYGDMIQFIRFARALHELGASSVTILSTAILRDLFASVDGVDRVVVYHDELISADIREDLNSVFLKMLPEQSSAACVPYVGVPFECRQRWSKCIDAGAFTVGLVWSSSQQSSDPYTDRNLPFAALTPVLDIPRVKYYSLQKNPCRSGTASRSNTSIVDLSGQLSTFTETAAAATFLDLVVTVDTSVAHLAGALNRPTALLLPYHHDWRWPAEGNITPWYPSVRIFRQRSPGAWAEVIDQIQDLIASQAGSKNAANGERVRN